MLPVARTALRRIGDGTDVVTYVSRYTRGRFAVGVRTRTPRWSTCRRAWTPTGSQPDPVGPRGTARPLRAGRAPRGRLRVAAGAAQGAGHVDPGAAGDPANGSTAPRSSIVGGGPYLDDAAAAGARDIGVAEHVVFTGGVPGDELPAHHAMADVFAMPCRTRGAGLDVEGLGIVYLEASATGVPVVAGDSGGAPETVLRRRDRAWSSTAGTSARSPPPSASCSPTRPGGRDGRGGPRMGDVDNWQWDSAGRGGLRGELSASGRGTELGARAFCVERLDVVGELLGHHLALDLQRRRQLAGVLGEVDRQDAELADRLGLRHRLVGVLDGQVDLGDAGRGRRPGRRPRRRRPCRCAASSRRTPRGRW